MDVELLMKIELADKLGYVCQRLVGGVGVNLAENGGHLLAVVASVNPNLIYLQRLQQSSM